MKKKQVAFSHFNCFESKGRYGFGGENSFSLAYNDGVLKVDYNFKPSVEWRLINDANRAGVLRDICYKLKKGILVLNLFSKLMIVIAKIQVIMNML